LRLPWKARWPEQEAIVMQIGVVGLGRMGGNIVRRLIRHGHQAVVHDRDRNAVKTLTAEGATGAEDIDGLVQKLQSPRTIWVMLPAGEITETAVRGLGDRLQPGDTIIDGGNTFWRDDIRRARALKELGLHYVDVGTSGGVWGLERGYCMMIGGEKDVVEWLDPIFAALAPGLGKVVRTPGRDGRDPRAERGYIHAGPNGAGHFVKMVHNGIEYGLMAAYAEGFDILKHAADETRPAEERFALDLADVAEVWRRGSVVSSWLLDLTASALAQDAQLEGYSGYVEDSGEGRWTIMAAIEEAVSADVLSAALFARFRSRQGHTFAEKILSAMRKGFGGHIEPDVRHKVAQP
jgi:6-phosphogluconate dehydrogenase